MAGAWAGRRRGGVAPALGSCSSSFWWAWRLTHSRRRVPRGGGPQRAARPAPCVQLERTLPRVPRPQRRAWRAQAGAPRRTGDPRVQRRAHGPVGHGCSFVARCCRRGWACGSTDRPTFDRRPEGPVGSSQAGSTRSMGRTRSVEPVEPVEPRSIDFSRCPRETRATQALCSMYILYLVGFRAT